MPSERPFESQLARLPNVDSFVLGGSRNDFVVRGDLHSIDVLLVRHDGHSGRFNDAFFALPLRNVHVPNFERVVLTH